MRIAVVTSGFPRRSETFALHELLALESAGMLAGVFATKPGDGLPAHPAVARLRTPVVMLPRGAPDRQAAAVADELRSQRIDGVHGYFAHEPAAVAAAAAELLRVRYGFSVHARDARKVSRDDLAKRASNAVCVIACNEDVAAEIPGQNGRLHLVPHGVDLARFAPSDAPAAGPARVLAVGRLVEKKGFAVLIDAARLVEHPIELRIVGDGPERERLQGCIDRAALASRVTLVGSRTHDELPDEYRWADVVVAPSVCDRTGDRDGLPNVILEAMASGRPVVATRVGAIASAVEHGTTGWLVAPEDPVALARAIDRLVADRELRERAGKEARRNVESRFALADCTARFRQVVEQAYA